MNFDKKTIVIIVLAVIVGWLAFGPDSCPIRQACGLSKGACASEQKARYQDKECGCDSEKGDMAKKEMKKEGAAH